MTIRTVLAASAAMLSLSIATAAAAHGVGGFMCQTFNMSKNTPPMTHCVTWTREAAKRMREAPCDPSKMSVEEMRRRCAEMSAAPTAPSNG